MTPDDQARLLDELPAEVTRRILDTLPPDELKAARDLLGYPPHAAGRYMTPRYVALRPDMTAGEALAHVRQLGPDQETLAILYVVDDDRRLLKELRLGTLVLADPDARVADIPDRPLVSIPATADREEAVRLFRKYDRAALPVTDPDGRMLGIITADDVLDVAEREATEDMQKAGGMEALDGPYLEVGFLRMMRKRGGWLSVLFLGEMLTATAMGYFEGEIEKAVVLAMFVPLIISSGGNSGSQASTLVVRSLALTELRLADWWRVLGRELRSGLALGAWLGFIGFLRVTAWHELGLFDYGPHHLLVGLTVWLSLIGVVTFGSVSGSMLPFVLRRAGVRPGDQLGPVRGHPGRRDRAGHLLLGRRPDPDRDPAVTANTATGDDPVAVTSVPGPLERSRSGSGRREPQRVMRPRPGTGTGPGRSRSRTRPRRTSSIPRPPGPGPRASRGPGGRSTGRCSRPRATAALREIDRGRGPSGRGRCRREAVESGTGTARPRGWWPGRRRWPRTPRGSGGRIAGSAGGRGVLQAPGDLGGEDVAGNPDDEQLAQAGVEHPLRREPRMWVGLPTAATHGRSRWNGSARFVLPGRPSGCPLFR